MPVLKKMLVLCPSTVLELISSILAISRIVKPLEIRLIISISLGVNLVARYSISFFSTVLLINDLAMVPSG